MRTTNPVLNAKTFADVRRVEGTPVMTLEGTVNRTAFLLLILMATATWTWMEAFIGAPVNGYLFVGLLGGFAVGLVTVFAPGIAKFTAPIMGDSEETWKAIDERFKTLSQRLKAEVEQERASAGADSGGGGGGSSTANWGGEDYEPAAGETDSGSRPPDDDLARAAIYALAQPEHVDVNEILFRPARQEL